jgi:stage V sporulation protein D (sporulation-specific penicillin-binding protein)
VADQNLADVSDFDSLRTETNAAVVDPAPIAPSSLAGGPAPTVELAEGEGIPVPQLAGKTVREATQECMKMGLSPVLVGTGIAVEQSPEAGIMIRRGSRITVRFARGASLFSAASRRRVN